MHRTLALSLGFWFVVAVPASAEKRPMALDDLFAFQRVADPQISPDGKQVVYQVTTVDLDGNKTVDEPLARRRRRQDAAATADDHRQERPPPALVAGRQEASCSSRTAPARTSSGSSTWPAARPGS